MPSSYSFGFPELLLSSRLAEAGGDESWTYEIALAADGARQPFLIAAGLEQALVLLDDLAQAAADLALLRAEPGPQRIDASLDGESLARVGALRFHGDVEAVPEGTVVFAGEPLLRVRAPAAEAAAVIGAVAGVVRTQTAVATRVARLRLAAKGKPIWEAAGEQVTRDEALLIARAAQVGGAVGTTDPFAAAVHSLAALPQVPFSALVEMEGKLRGLGHCAVVVDGCMRRNPGAALAALAEAPRALVVDAGPDGLLDGELGSLRARLDEMGYAATRLLVGGVCDELRIGALASGGAPIDGFVTGATLLTGRHALHEELLAELVERTSRSGIQAVGRRDGGSGARAVWRRRECGQFRGDTIQADTQAPPPASAPLLVPMMRGGKRLFRAPSLTEVRVLCEAQLSMLDARVTALVDRVAYPLAFIGGAGPSQAAPKAAAAVTSAPPAAPPAAPPKPRLIDQVDDSADFTLVSNAFATVMTEQLGFESQEEPAAAESHEAPVEPTVEAAAEATVEVPVEVTVEASVEASAAPAEPAEEPMDVAEAAVVEEPALAIAEPLASAAPPAPAAEPERLAPVTSPLLAAAARLRAMQRGEPLPSAPAASVALLESAPPPAPEPVVAPPPAAAAVSDNPLLAAAARLRSMRGG